LLANFFFVSIFEQAKKRVSVLDFLIYVFCWFCSSDDNANFSGFGKNKKKWSSLLLVFLCFCPVFPENGYFVNRKCLKSGNGT
jgi:hypothetical protein